MALVAWQATITNESGDVQTNASVEVRVEASGALAATYSDRDGASPVANPLTADSGGFVRFYAAGGAYRITATRNGFERIWRHVSLGALSERDDVPSSLVRYEQTAAEVTVGVTPTDDSYPPGDTRRTGDTGDGTTDDKDAQQETADVENGTSFIAKGDHNLSNSGPVSWTDTVIQGEAGSVIKGNAGADSYQVHGRVSVRHLEFDTHDNALVNDNTTDGAVELSVSENEFHSGDNIPLFVSAPITYANVIGNYFHDGMGQQIRFGVDTHSLQAGWHHIVAAFNFFQNINTTTGASTAAVLSYVPFSKLIGNHAESISGDTANETWFFYVKSPHGIVALNTGNGLTDAVAGTMYGLNLKGTARGTSSTPNGYGALGLANQLVGSDEGVAFQMEAEEQALIANSAEGFPDGIEQGSGDMSCNRTIANRLRGTAASGSMGHGMTASGTKFLNALNMSYSFESGTSIFASGATTIDRIIQLGEHHEGINNAAGRGLEIIASTPGNITRAIVGDITLRSFDNGVRLDGVIGAILHDLDISDIGNDPTIFDFTDSAQIVGRNFYRKTTQTTDATATNVLNFPLATNGQSVHIKMTAIARRNDGTEHAHFERHCLAKRESGTTSVVEQSTAFTLGNGAGTLEADGSIDFNASGSNIQCRVTGKAATTYNWMCTFDCELL